MTHWRYDDLDSARRFNYTLTCTFTLLSLWLNRMLRILRTILVVLFICGTRDGHSYATGMRRQAKDCKETYWTTGAWRFSLLYFSSLSSSLSSPLSLFSPIAFFRVTQEPLEGTHALLVQQALLVSFPSSTC